LAILATAAVAVFLVGRPGGDAVEGYAYPVPPSHSGNTVEVLNGTSQTGLARRGTRALRAEGFDVVFFGNAAPVDSTQIVVRRGSDRIGARLVEALGGGIIRFEEDTLRRVDATVILGGDYHPSPAPSL
jgi:hypothetical protein